MYFETKIYKFLNEEDVSDKVIKYKDADGNEKEATVGGILKKGKDHPAHDLAQKEMDKAQGDDKQEPKPSAKIDANPFDNEEPSDEPSDKPRGADIVGSKKNAEEAAGELASITADMEDLDGPMPKGVARQVAQHEADILASQGINKSPDGTYSTESYDAINNKVVYEPMSEEEVLKALSDKTGRTPNEIANMRDAAKKANPAAFPPDDDKPKDDEPSSASSDDDTPTDRIEAEKDKLSDLFDKRKDDPEDVDAHDEMYDTLKNIFGDSVDGAIMATAVMESGLDDFEDAEDFLEQLRDEAEAFEEEMEESKQPFKENYNRLFKGRDLI